MPPLPHPAMPPSSQSSGLGTEVSAPV